MKLESGDSVLITSAADKNDLVVSLKLNKLQLKDAGQIRVHAVNSEGEANEVTALMVKGNFTRLFENKIYGNCKKR